MLKRISKILPDGPPRDLAELGELIAFHRRMTAGLRMEDDDGGGKDDDSGDDGDDDGGKDDDSGDDGDDDGGKDDKKPLGDKGKQAIDRMKSTVKTERAKRRELEKFFTDLGMTRDEVKAKLEELNAGGGGDKKPPVDVEKIKREARQSADADVLKERVLDKIEARAGGKFNLDPEDVAVLLLRRNDIEDFLDDGKIDVEAIQEALDDLLEKMPNLSAQGGKRFQGDGDNGPRNASKKSQLTEADLDKMSPAEIDKARKEGRFDKVMGKV